jgi:tetratricopeptide (TPR) repeat protein
MRLLHFNEAGRLALINFHDEDSIPPYSILSHRWGGSEVLYQDLDRDEYKEKEGYQKIKFCAKQSAEDQLKYFWVDTCCIDKWNLTELSQSINSMFRWYKNAVKCYVFLPDVSVPDVTEVCQQNNWESSFRTSDWFTRGWTLQELIAPQQVEFFSRQGQKIGDKASLGRLIHEITHLPHMVLQNCPFNKFSIAERKKWAANRKTTEEEDIVYCLLGILDVSMPVSYGEGKEMAMRRLQMFEEEAAGSAPCLLPFPQNFHFVGGKKQIAKLEAKLFGDQQTTTLAIVGPSGVGKSQLALELAYRIRHKNQSCSVFWIDASDMNSIIQSYARIAQKLGISDWEDEDMDVKVKLHLEEETTRHCLLIFDNIGGLSREINGPSTNFMQYLPRSKSCAIIFTTAGVDTAENLAVQTIVELQESSPAGARKMLDNYLSTALAESQQSEAQLLLNELCFVPLAIVQAAAYINAAGTTLQEYRTLLNRQYGTAVTHSSDLPRANLEGRSLNDPIAATLLISIEQIHHSNTLASEYLCLAACVGQKDVPLDLFPAPSAREREDAIKVLSRYKLVIRRPAESALELHQLVHHALRDWLEKEDLLCLWAQRAIARVWHVFPARTHNKRSKWRRLLQHVQFVLSHSHDEGVIGPRLKLAWGTALALYEDGHYDEAEELFVQVLETRAKALGKEHPDTMKAMTNLALTYQKQGRLKDAEELLLSVVEVRKKVLGEDDPSTLTGIGFLAETYSDQGRWKEAEELELHVVERRKILLGGEHTATLAGVANLASTYKALGRYEEAQALEEEVLAIKKRLLGEEHPETLTSMSNLACGYGHQEQWNRATELHMHVLETRKRVLGKEHPHTLISMMNLAFALKDQHRDEEALTLLRAHFVLSSQTLGNLHRHTKSSLEHILDWETKETVQ